MADSPSSDDSKRPSAKLREAEYQALWQVCDRTARKNEYKYADYATRRAILEDACHALMNRRRDSGKVICNTSIPEMVDRHLKREAHSRIIHEARVTGQLPDSPGPVTRSARSATPQGNMADPPPMGRIALPFGNNNNTQPYAANIDPNPLTLRNEIVALRQELAHQREDQLALVSTMRGVSARLFAVENELAELRGGQGYGRLSFNEMDVHLRQTDLASRPRAVPMGENGLHHVGEPSAATQMNEGDVHFRPPSNYTYESDPRHRASGLLLHGTYPGPLYPDEGVEGPGFPPGFGPGLGSRPRERRPVTPRSQTHGREDMGRDNI